MSRLRLIALLVALALVGLAIWMSSGERSRGGRRGVRGATGVKGGAEDPRSVWDARPLGVASRDEGPGAALVVSGRVEDRDGVPVSEGRLALECLPTGGSQGVPSPHGALELGADGEFTGPGCRGTICASLVHTSMIQDDAWVLVPGRPALLIARQLGRQDGVVVDAEGSPVAGARMLVRPLPGEHDPTALPPFTSRSAVSDAEGYFTYARVERPPCDPCGEASGRCTIGDDREVPTYAQMLLIARAPGYRSSEAVVEVDDDEPWRVVMEEPAPPIRGRLVDEQGRPYPRARILARSSERAYEVHQAAVDDGDFELGELSDGAYDLRALQDGIELAAQSGVDAGATVELRGGLPAEGIALTLRILDRGGAPLVGALVDGGPFSGERSDARGEVQAEAVLPGAYDLQVRAPGRGPERHPVMVSDGEPALVAEIRVGGGR